MPSPQPGDWWPEGGVTSLLKRMDACGIERAVIFPPFACQMGHDLRRANLWALNEIKAHRDRLTPAGTVFPLSRDVCEVTQMLHDQGVCLLKIHPSIDQHDIADPAARPFYARAGELGMILNYHTGAHGTRLSLARPEKFDDLSFDFPKLRLVFEHLGGRAYFHDFTAIIANHPGQCFGGLTSIFNPAQYVWHVAPLVAEMIRGLGAKHFIYGMDFPWNSEATTRRDLEVIRSLDIAESDKELILGGNLARLLAG
ncbi:MAG: amidohydrolase family protein [Verrucomicrobia bacterium]|nr:amidohydrolase family protein [Verrucomicrobiota bacterium]